MIFKVYLIALLKFCSSVFSKRVCEREEFSLLCLQFLTLMAAIMALFLIARVSQSQISGNCALNIFSSNPNGHERAGESVRAGL